MIEVDVITEDGSLGRSGASTGTSVGKNESVVLRDGDPKLFAGLSVFKAIENIKEYIEPALVGMDVTDQKGIDQRLLELDGTPNKEKLGGNTINAASFAAARAGAAYTRQPFYRYMALGEIKTHFAPALNLINGGTYYGITQPFQEFMLIPRNVDTFMEAVQVGVEVFYKVGELIEKYRKQPAITGNYCGYGAPSDDPSVIFDILMEAVAQTGYQNKACFAMDCAASEFYDEQKGLYLYRGKYADRDEIITILSGLCTKYPIGFVEDALEEEDFEGFRLASQRIEAAVIGDDFLCTSIERAKKAVNIGAVKGMIEA
ncbi:phosphopyruvate hydratase [Petroclostridium sp. X23]|uniref:phosphopyruvate hydratase n=1 Tax=Petroclostridium sp. X23 TaxID=3045146 RepID=UPI0024AE4A82|nr:phosphopyruvate hydratase [Petroclostridium sp. X23]WHH58045.1 phosphopyruvate hydratase [Petroclostridium sp. X23]